MPSSSERGPRWTVGSVTAIIVAGSLAPLVGYWLLFGRIDTVTPQEAKQCLRAGDEPVALVDVRSREVFLDGHIDGALNWPLAEILESQAPQDVPVALRDKTLLLVCDVGMASRQAARHLAQGRIAPAKNVRGGIQEWIRSAAIEQPRRLPPADGQVLRWLEDATEPARRSVRPMADRPRSSGRVSLSPLAGAGAGGGRDRLLLPQADLHDAVGRGRRDDLETPESGSGRLAMGDDLLLPGRGGLRGKLLRLSRDFVSVGVLARLGDALFVRIRHVCRAGRVRPAES